jgi:hypothetical protein
VPLGFVLTHVMPDVRPVDTAGYVASLGRVLFGRPTR